MSKKSNEDTTTQPDTTQGNTTASTAPEPRKFVPPPGFEEVSDGDLLPPIKFEPGMVVTGTVLSIKTVAVPRPGGPEDTLIMRLDSNGERIAVWHSAGLKDLFNEAQKGDEVYIEMIGLEELGGGRNPMKNFFTAIKPAAKKSGGK